MTNSKVSNLIIIVISILTVLHVNMLVVHATSNLSDTKNDAINEAIIIVHRTSQEYPQEKIRNTDGVVAKLIKPLIVTTRKEAHQDIVGKKLKDSLMYLGNYNGHIKTLKLEHELRVTKVKDLKNQIDLSYKTLDKFVKTQMDGSSEAKKETRKALSDLRKYSKNSLDRIYANYATVDEYDSVYKAVELLWSDLSESQMNLNLLSSWASSMQQLSEDIPRIGFMKGNAHLWWLFCFSLLVSLVIFLYTILTGVIKAVPYIAAEGMGIILEVFQNGFEWIIDRFRRR